MNSNELGSNAIEILKKMGYREFEGGYIKPISIFKHHIKNTNWVLAEYLIGDKGSLVCWKSKEIDFEELEILDVQEFQTLEAFLKEDFQEFFHSNSEILVPELTKSEN